MGVEGEPGDVSHLRGGRGARTWGVAGAAGSGVSLVLPALGSMLAGPLAWVLLAGMALGGIFKVVWDRRLGVSVTRSIAEMVIIGALAYGLVFGSIWTLKNYVLSPENVASIVPSAGTPTSNAGGHGGTQITGTVTSAGLFMREGPGTEYKEVRAYTEGAVVQVVGKEPAGGWVKVVAPGGSTGWMSVRFLRLNVGVEKVPVVEVPPLPTPSRAP